MNAIDCATRTADRSPSIDLAHQKYRDDIQGLRAVAALLVAVYHIWFHRVSGAVDLFFFISAYFMTGSLLRRVPTSGWREIPRFWGNLLKRMLPQAWSVILVTIVVSYLVVPMSWWRQTIDEIAAAATFSINWVLAFNQINYLDQENPASIVQHFWAMAVQMQTYLVWPIVVGGAIMLARRFHRSPESAVMGTMALVGATSLWYSVWATNANQQFAYFDTFARTWEFAAGGAFVVLVNKVHLPGPVRTTAGWVGLVGLVSLGAVLDVSTLFPGWIAILPIAFAALIFVGGAGRGAGFSWGVDRILATRLLVHLGSVSYGIYLWHWPILVAWRWQTDRVTPSWWEGLVIIGLAIMFAEVSTRYIERPIRRGLWRQPKHAASPKRSWGSAAALVTMGLVGAISLQGWQIHVATLSAAAEASGANPGAAILSADYLGPSAFESLQPALTEAGSDWATYDPTGCEVLASEQGSEAQHCWIAPAGTATKTVMVVGDSHVGGWLAALVPIAVDNGWRLEMFSMGGCRIRTVSESRDDDRPCTELNSAALEFASTHSVDALMTVGNQAIAGSPDVQFPAGFVPAISQYLDLGVTAVVFRDQPRYENDPKECLSRAATVEDATTECVVSRDSLLADGDFAAMLPEELSGRSDVVTIDMSDSICPDDVCPAVIGGVVVTQDSNHVTATYIETMTPEVASAWQAATGWLR